MLKVTPELSYSKLLGRLKYRGVEFIHQSSNIISNLNLLPRSWYDWFWNNLQMRFYLYSEW